MGVCVESYCGWLSVKCFSVDVCTYSACAFLIVMLTLMYVLRVLTLFWDCNVDLDFDKSYYYYYYAQLTSMVISRHFTCRGPLLLLSFTGNGNQAHTHTQKDRTLIQVLSSCQWNKNCIILKTAPSHKCVLPASGIRGGSHSRELSREKLQTKTSLG